VESSVVSRKLDQAVGFLREAGIDLWIAQFARESYEQPTPVDTLAVGCSVTWPAAFLVAASGRRTAIVGTGDVANVRAAGVYDEVVGYVQDVAVPLREVMSDVNPTRVAVSYSVADDMADNITHGMFLMLQGILAGTPYFDCLVPAEGILGKLRAYKLPVEVRRIQDAIEMTHQLFGLMPQLLREGVTESELADRLRGEGRARGGAPAWDPRYDPIVNFGPGSGFGHSEPGTVALAPGMLVHIDLGLKVEGYCSDLQRTWYVLRPSESEAPLEVQEAFAAVRVSMDAGFETLRPGIPGWTADRQARDALLRAGYAESEFAFGHQLGQTAHDGGALLGPPWPRYGTRPEMPLGEGMVFAIEQAVPTEAGPIGLEDDVLITAGGAEYLSQPQTALEYVRL